MSTIDIVEHLRTALNQGGKQALTSTAESVIIAAASVMKIEAGDRLFYSFIDTLTEAVRQNVPDSGASGVLLN